MATIKIECPHCNGTGNDPEADIPLYGCLNCDGEGSFEEEETEEDSVEDLFAMRVKDKCGAYVCSDDDEHCACRAWAEDRAAKFTW